MVESSFTLFPRFKISFFNIYPDNRIDTVIEGYTNEDKSNRDLEERKALRKESYFNILSKICSKTDGLNKQLLNKKVDESKLKVATEAIICQIT